jgi:hypothetical protein
LADAGLFQIGAVLVGSHAFGLYGNLLGAKWDRAITHTQDIDIAHDPTLQVAVRRIAPVDIPKKLEEWSAMTFLPVPPSPVLATRFVRPEIVAVLPAA